jgi:hypothetical protein
MKIPALTRLAVVVATVVLPAGRPAQADVPPTIVLTGSMRVVEIDGTVGSDLDSIDTSGAENTWTLTMVGTSFSHSTSSNNYFTDITASSFTMSFSGPNADTLNSVVGAGLAGGTVDAQLRNVYQAGGDWSMLALWVVGPAGISFWAGNESDVNLYTFPADAQGYPTVTSTPFDFDVEEVYVGDYRPGNGGALWSWNDRVSISGSVGTPIAPTISVSDNSVYEGNRGTTKAGVYVSLANTSASTITVKYKTVAGTATAKSDFNAASGTLTFQPGVTRILLTVGIKADRSREPNESFTIQLYDAIGTTISDATGQIVILNDD